MQLPDYADLFLRYDYAESKDLLKEFLTLVSGVLVFSVTFAEKIIGFSEHRSRGRWTLFGSWLALIAALVSGGCSLGLLALAANSAVHGHGKPQIISLENEAVICMLGGGAFFVISLMLIAAAGALSLFARRVSDTAVAT